MELLTQKYVIRDSTQFAGENYYNRFAQYGARIQVRSATLIDGVRGRDALVSNPLDRRVKVAVIRKVQ